MITESSAAKDLHREIYGKANEVAEPLLRLLGQGLTEHEQALVEVGIQSGISAAFLVLADRELFDAEAIRQRIAGLP